MNPNSYKNQKNRALRRKIEIIFLKGGSCSKCGYNRNLAALEFHHTNPNVKDFQLDSRRLSNTSLEKLKIEISKCELLCSNCHREYHNPNLETNKIKLVINNNRTISNPYKKQCKHCKKHFPSKTGKLFCSKECRINYKNYPTLSEIYKLYDKLKSWEKVSKHFSLTRRIIQNIRKSGLPQT